MKPVILCTPQEEYETLRKQALIFLFLNLFCEAIFQKCNDYYFSPQLIEALICRASVVDRNAVSTLANEIQSLLLCRLCGSCQRREPFLFTCFTLKAITSLNRLNLKARGCFMKRDRGENKPTNRRKGARRRL